MTYSFWRNAAIAAIIVGSLTLAGSALASAFKIAPGSVNQAEIAKKIYRDFVSGQAFWFGEGEIGRTG